MTVGEALDELYRTDPSSFVARRGELAKALVAEGDRAGAKEVRAAKRPTVAAWALNQLRDRAPAAVDEAVEVAAAWSDAQAELRDGGAADVRSLAGRRRELVAALGRAARAVLRDADRSSAAIERQVTDTIDAAAASPEVARRLADGRFTTAETATGLEGLFGGGGPVDEVAAARRRRARRRAGTTPEPAGDEADEADEAEVAADEVAADEVAAAEQEARRAARAEAIEARDRAEARSRQAATALAEADERVGAAERALTEAEERLADARAARDDADQVARAAREAAAEAERRVVDLDAEA